MFFVVNTPTRFAAAISFVVLVTAVLAQSIPAERPRNRPPSMLTGRAPWEKGADLLKRISVPPAPPLSPEEALKTFRVAPGFRIELVAAEPMVQNPIAFEFDPDGRIWVVEYHHTVFDHYFMTADPDEIAGLDGGAYGGVFVRTGEQFLMRDGPVNGTVDVCRFFTTPGNFGAKSSHFYTADEDECAGVKLNPNWIYEKIAFFTYVPTAGDCGPAGIKVYRMYNNGMTGAPNHRFTTSPTIYELFTTTLGWAPEGVRFCAIPLV